MRSVHIDFEASGAALDFTKESEGFRNTSQNVLVHIGQSPGNPFFPDRGNDLHRTGVVGGFADAGVFRQALQLLESDLVTFSQAFDEAGAGEKIDKVDLTLTGWGVGAAAVKVATTSDAGETSLQVFKVT